jgi:hypothetical protein
MPAKLDLLHRKVFSLTLSDGTIVEGQFGTWALARFGQKKKLSLSQIITLFDEPQVMDLIEWVLCALEYKEREAGKPPFMNELKLSKWIDDYTADSGEPGVLMKLWTHSNESEKLDMPESEKKTEESLVGETSNGTSLQPAAP